MAVHLIFLAAGFSRRFGSNKHIYQMDGKPMYRHVLDRLLEILKDGTFCADLTVVTQYDRICREMAGEPCTVAVNPDPSRGISSSLAEAILSLERRGALSEDDLLVFFNADQPKLRKETICRFLEKTLACGADLAAAGINGIPKNPCAFRGKYAAELKKLTGDTGGKQLIRRFPEHVFVFNEVSEEELEDIDML